MGFIESTERFVRKVSEWVNRFGVSLLMLMMFVTSLDVVLRYLRMPIEGAFEMVTFTQVVFVSFALAYTQAVKGNITADLIVRKLPQKIQALTGGFTTLLSLVLAVLMCWQSILRGEALRQAGQHSVALEIPLFPFYWAVGFGAGLLALVLLVDFFIALTGRSSKE